MFMILHSITLCTLCHMKSGSSTCDHFLTMLISGVLKNIYQLHDRKINAYVLYSGGLRLKFGNLDRIFTVPQPFKANTGTLS